MSVYIPPKDREQQRVSRPHTRAVMRMEERKAGVA